MKTTFRTILISAFATFIAFTAIIYISCKPDKCANVACVNGGTCNGSGVCVCVTGYEGSSCQTQSRTKFIGNWGVTNSTTVTEPATFGVSIAAGLGLVTNVTISNFHAFFTTVNATVSGDSITIPSQLLQGHIVSGSGYIYTNSAYGVNGSITMSYAVTDTTSKVTIYQTEAWGG